MMRPYVFFIFLLFSCSSSREVPGEYLSSKSPYSLILNKDSTFSYRYKFEFAYKYSSGTWNKTGKNKIILNSYIKERRLPLKIYESGNNEENKSNVNFLSVNVDISDADKKYYWCEIFINDALYEKINCDSLSSISITPPINSVFFGLTADERIPGRFLDTLYTDKFFPKSNSANKLKADISYIDSLFNYRVFNNEVLKMTRKGLNFYNYQSSEWQSLPKRIK